MNSDGTSFTMIMPRESGPKACSRVEKETLPRPSQIMILEACWEGRKPFFKSSKLTVTADEDISAKFMV